MNKPRSIYQKLIAGALALTGGMSVVQADNSHSYMPSFCRLQSGELTIGPVGEIYNASTTSALTVECPIVREEMVYNVEHTGITYRDRHHSQDVSCHMRYRTLTGAIGTSVTISIDDEGHTYHSYSVDAKVMTMYKGTGSFYLDDNTSIMMVCTIPPAEGASPADRSAIFSYRVQENN